MRSLQSLISMASIPFQVHLHAFSTCLGKSSLASVDLFEEVFAELILVLVLFPVAAVDGYCLSCWREASR